MFSKTLLKTNSLTLNACSVVSRSLTTASVFASLGISIQMVGIPISVGMIASIPYVRANGDSPVGFRLVVL